MLLLPSIFTKTEMANMSGIWPDDIRCVALVTFDVDGVPTIKEY